MCRSGKMHRCWRRWIKESLEQPRRREQPPKMELGLDQCAQSLSCSKPIENTGREMAKVEGGRKEKKKETILPTKEGSEALDASRTRPIPRKRQSCGQDQPAQHLSAHVISWHPLMSLTASGSTHTKWSLPATLGPSFPGPALTPLLPQRHHHRI